MTQWKNPLDVVAFFELCNAISFFVHVLADRWCLRCVMSCDTPSCNMWTRLRCVIYAQLREKLHFIFAKRKKIIDEKDLLLHSADCSRGPKIDDTNLSSIRKELMYNRILTADIGDELSHLYLLICVLGSFHTYIVNHIIVFSAKCTIICDSRSKRKTQSSSRGLYSLRQHCFMQKINYSYEKNDDRLSFVYLLYT